MKFNDFYQLYWKHYLDLENEVFELDKYCYITNDNDNTYSRKYLELILSICSEIDIVLKAICKIKDNSFDPKNSGIDEYREIINNSFGSFKNEILCVTKTEYADVTPFKQFSTQYSPSWWVDYNQIKHHRDENNNFKKAKLGNVIRSLCALHLSLQYLAVSHFVDFDNIQERNDNLGALYSKRIKIKGWSYISYFNCDAQYIDERLLKKHFDELNK